MRSMLVLCAGFAVALLSVNASAVTYGFQCITGNVAGDCAIGEAQLSVDVTGPTSGQVLFTFSNVGSEASSVAEVYFDDGSLGGPPTLIQGSGVSFTVGNANPSNLPGGNSVGFTATQEFSADAGNQAPTDGLNPGETLGILFNIQGGLTLADVLNDLNSGAIRIGLHVIAFESGKSASFVNAVPLPAAAWLFLSALAGLFGLKRYQQKTA